jgi:hypothetical protein
MRRLKSAFVPFPKASIEERGAMVPYLLWLIALEGALAVGVSVNGIGLTAPNTSPSAKRSI